MKHLVNNLKTIAFEETTIAIASRATAAAIKQGKRRRQSRGGRRGSTESFYTRRSSVDSRRSSIETLQDRIMSRQASMANLHKQASMANLHRRASIASRHASMHSLTSITSLNNISSPPTPEPAEPTLQPSDSRSSLTQRKGIVRVIDSLSPTSTTSTSILARAENARLGQHLLRPSASAPILPFRRRVRRHPFARQRTPTISEQFTIARHLTSSSRARTLHASATTPTLLGVVGVGNIVEEVEVVEGEWISSPLTPKSDLSAAGRILLPFTGVDQKRTTSRHVDARSSLNHLQEKVAKRLAFYRDNEIEKANLKKRVLERKRAQALIGVGPLVVHNVNTARCNTPEARERKRQEKKVVSVTRAKEVHRRHEQVISHVGTCVYVYTYVCVMCVCNGSALMYTLSLTSPLPR